MKYQVTKNQQTLAETDELTEVVDLFLPDYLWLVPAKCTLVHFLHLAHIESLYAVLADRPRFNTLCAIHELIQAHEGILIRFDQLDWFPLASLTVNMLLPEGYRLEVLGE